ncbi:MAG: LysR family transcriptional regulator [Erysipelotrichaceae bacterium]|nr:LysR family transcriptional regulator [Erysipelotrichaceae bacterium]
MLDSKIYTLLKVAETGNYTRAGKLLNLTQPAVSQHIRALETETGVKIFERTGNRLILTREGEKVLKCAKAMLSLYNNLKSDLQDQASGKLSLNIGITHTVESNRISEALAKYVSSYPGLTVKLITDTMDKLRDKLKNFELDFAIIDGKISDPAFNQMQLDMDSLMLVTSPDHVLAGKSIVTIQDIKKEKLILRSPNSGTRNLFIASLESQNISIDEFDVILEVDNIATIKNLVRQGYGVSVLPKSACVDDTKKKLLSALPIENMSMIREINIVYGTAFNYPELLQNLSRIYNEM